MAPFGRISAARIGGEELTASQTDMDEDGGDEDDAAGVLSIGWDREEGPVVVEEKGWLEEDDIEEWD
jgi:cell cycle checkpoint protein